MHFLYGYFAKYARTVNVRYILFPAFLSAALLSAGDLRMVGFDEALHIADSTHPEILSARSRIAELTFKQRQITASLFPQIDASASYTRLGETPPGKKYLLGESENDIYTDISARQTLFDGGRYYYQKASTDKQASVEGQKLELIRRNIRTAVARAWLEAMRARYVVSVQRDLIARLQEQKGIAELLYSSGKVSNLDVLRIKTQILSAQGQLRSLEAVLAGRLYSLAQAIGTTDEITVPDEADSLLGKLFADAVCVSTDAAISSPDVNSAKALWEKSIIDQRVLSAEYLPTLYAKAGFNLEDNTVIPQNPNWSAGAILNVPIFRGGGLRAQSAQARERSFQAEKAIDIALTSITAKILSAKESVREKQDRIAIAEQTYAAAEETNDVAGLRYSSGKLSAFELLEAQNILARSRLDIVNARIDYRIAIEDMVALCASETIDKGAK